jgi:hypothetical protein
MDAFTAVLFVLFMLLVDWRLNKIFKELVRLNRTTEQSLASPQQGSAS